MDKVIILRLSFVLNPGLSAPVVGASTIQPQCLTVGRLIYLDQYLGNDVQVGKASGITPTQSFWDQTSDELKMKVHKTFFWEKILKLFLIEFPL